VGRDTLHDGKNKRFASPGERDRTGHEDWDGTLGRDTFLMGKNREI